MSHSVAPTRLAPSGLHPADRHLPPEGAPTAVFRAPSTPGPAAPGRATDEATERLGEPPAVPVHAPAIPGYEDVTGPVARGGMGVVYQARHVPTGRTVALKLTIPVGTYDDTTRDRFVREVRTLAALKHPNIVPLYDAGEWAGFPFCTMEFVPGGTLHEHLDRVRADLRGAVRLMAKVARAVDALHAAGVVHRDLKPLNILLGPGDEPLVADFGLAKRLAEGSDLTLTGMPVGTRQYMAPEQTLCGARFCAPACDVWALGVTLYELLTGERPFRDDGPEDVYDLIRRAEPRPIGELAPDVPVELQAVVRKCLARRPDDRYPSAAALADDLERWLSGEPVRAEPPAEPAPAPAPVPPESRKKPRPGRVLLVTAAALAAVAVVALTGFTSRDRKAQQELPLLSAADREGAPRSELAAAPPPRPRATPAERLARGLPVRLTDENGVPLVEVLHEPEYALHADTLGGKHAFTRTGTGIASLWDAPLPEAYKVEADVTLAFQGNYAGKAGFYVGRRRWDGLPLKVESLFAVGGQGAHNQGVTERYLRSSFTAVWWAPQQNAGSMGTAVSDEPWQTAAHWQTPRTARYAVEVRPDEVRATVNGKRIQALDPRPYTKNLPSAIDPRDWFPKGHRFEGPFLGNGIGIYCTSNCVVVANLTITKLDR